MKTIRLRDQLGVMRSFEGEPIPGATNDIQRTDEDGEARLRWVEMQLYRHADGGYILYRVGRTAPVYHRVGAACADSRHEKMPAHKLPESAVPCDRCKPLGMKAPKTLVSVEQDRPLLDRCYEPEDVVRVLIEYRNTGGGKQPYLSRPAEELIRNAARADTDFQESWAEIEMPI